MSERLYEVILPARLQHPFTYALPDSLAAQALPGKRVLVPFGTKKMIGCLYRPCQTPPPKGLKSLLEILDPEPLLSPPLLKMIDFSSQYYLTPIGEVLRHFLPLDLLKRKEPSTRKLKPALSEGSSDYTLPTLTPEQSTLLQTIQSSVGRYLLHGITGSGKTEIYIHLAKEVLAQGKSVLVLLPEIGLTPQITERFSRSLTVPVAAYHSGLTTAGRARLWWRCYQGEARVVIGTRSAVFLPLQQLGLIVVDEEHDGSFKQEERFCYHARDLSLWRGQEEKATVVLGSATPSLESRYRASLRKLKILKLTRRPSGAALPAIELIDRRMITPDKGSGASPLSPALLQAMEATRRAGEQTLIFLNRRGYSPSLVCSRCGFFPRCPHCEISLTWHRALKKMLCHYCDTGFPYTAQCPKCQGVSLVPHGAGTEKIEEELRRHFPGARLARLDRDITAKKGWQEILKKMRRREIDILIGTQIVTKGHDYPFLTLVGIIDADVALHLPDFRSAERLYQLVLQVAGRAGRKDRPGRVLIQTYCPDHPALQAVLLKDESPFIKKELDQRQKAGYPPFRRLIQIRLSGPRDKVITSANHLTSALKKLRLQAEILGPAPCPMERIRNQHRWHLLIKTAHFTQIHTRLERLLDDFTRHGLPSGVRMLVNVDPVDMM